MFVLHRVSQLVSVLHSADVAVIDSTVKGDTVAVTPMHELQASLVKVPQTALPQLCVGHRVYRQLLAPVIVRG